MSRIVTIAVALLFAAALAACSRPVVPSETFPVADYQSRAAELVAQTAQALPNTRGVRLLPIAVRTNQRTGYIIDIAALAPPHLTQDAALEAADRAVCLATVHRTSEAGLPVHDDAMPNRLWYFHNGPLGRIQPPPRVPHAWLTSDSNGTLFVIEAAFRGSLPVGATCLRLVESESFSHWYDADFPAACTPLTATKLPSR